jgi:hypothetical protein
MPYMGRGYGGGEGGDYTTPLPPTQVSSLKIDFKTLKCIEVYQCTIIIIKFNTEDFRH